MELKEKIPDKEDLGRRKIFILGLLVFLGSGFVFAGIINLAVPVGQTCTLMECDCGGTFWGNESEGPSEIDGEKECNECSGANFLYHLGFFWVSQSCDSTQVMVCEDGEKVDEYYRTDSCDDYEVGNVFTSDFPREILRSL